jgi:hypothetical protein
VAKTKVAAYLPMSTLLTALDHLKAVSVPNKIDGGTFPSMSSQLRSQLISGLRFFELIDADGTPSPLLSDLATKDASRKEIMKQLIETHYPDIVALDFAKITPKQLDEYLSADKYGVQGDTKKKAKTFLLKAAQYAGFTVHPLLTKITRNRNKGSKKPLSASAQGMKPLGPKDKPDQRQSSENEKTIELHQGGSITLILDVNVLELKGEDRTFVFDLIDKIDAYESAGSE